MNGEMIWAANFFNQMIFGKIGRRKDHKQVLSTAGRYRQCMYYKAIDEDRI